MVNVFSWPLRDVPRRLSDGGTSEDHVARGGGFAIDIPAATWTPFYPALPPDTQGTVSWMFWDPECGNLVEYSFVFDATMWQVRYCHAEQVAVGVSDRLDRDTILGYVGSTGKSTGPHIHLALWRDGERVRPEDWLMSDCPDIEPELILIWDRLDRIQKASRSQKVKAWAEQAKQAAVADIKRKVGLQ